MLHETLRETSAIHAVVRLLADDDAKVLRLCRRRLLEWGSAAHAGLQAAESDDDPRVRVRARAVLRSLELATWTRAFAQDVAQAREVGGPHAVLEAGMRSLVAFVRHEAGDLGAFDAALEALAAELRPLVRGRSSLTAARHLAELLAKRHGLRGSRRMPADRLAWLPDRVLDTGRGPSSVLGALYLLVGRRAGLDLSSVLLPDFLLVRVHGRRRILVDPYHEGRTVTRHDCLRYVGRLERFGCGAAKRSLEDVDDADVLDRILEDLILVHDRPEQGEVRDCLRTARASLEPSLGRRFG
ncbi:MAG: hypothetical protein HZB39_17190 [Planctomycetes bacterium]|nr:hypothetical protein [Planctomycetota bacterium]